MKMFSAAFVAVLLLSNVSPLFAQTSQWAVKMFSEMGTERLHNFGSVALHADVEKRFQFKNIYNEDVVIASVSSNCGCTKASVSKQVVHPGEIGEVIARVDTSGREHTKQRKATIRVVFSKPTTAEVQLQVKTYIRPDIGFDPGVIEFGTVQHGVKSVKKAFLQYEGRAGWALTDIQKNNPGIRAEAREVRRQGGSVVYEILVELKSEASPGYLHDLLKLRTNEPDPATSTVFLPIQGLVVEPLSAKPSFLQLGVIEQDKGITRNVVVSGSEPFKILEVKSNDRRVSGAKTDLKRSVHVIQIEFNADENAGPVAGEIEIVTSLHDEDGGRQKLLLPMTGMVVKKGEYSAPDSSAAIPDSLQSKLNSPARIAPTNRGIPQATEGLEPTPLETGKTPKAKTNTNVRPEASEDDVEMEKLSNERERQGTQDAGVHVEIEERQEFVWKPVKKENAGKEELTKSSSSLDKQGEWTSNWKQVRKADMPEFISETPSESIVK